MSVPLQLITGFLGSGKTTFLKKYLDAAGPDAGKVAIVQNEFSPVSMDGPALRDAYRCEVLEVNNGSVFCVCLLGSFIDSLAAFTDAVRPDLLLMESSGLSDTLAVGQIFQSPKLRGKVYLDSVWCVVDAVHFDRAPALRLRLEHQLRSADCVVVSKLDLNPGAEAGVVSRVRQINPFAAVVRADFGQLPDYRVQPKLKFFPGENPVAGRPDVQSVVIRSSAEIGRDALLGFLAGLGENCLRAKGFVRLKRAGAYLQQVFGQTDLTPSNRQPATTELVLLGYFDPAANLQVQFDQYCRQ